MTQLTTRSPPPKLTAPSIAPRRPVARSARTMRGPSRRGTPRRR